MAATIKRIFTTWLALSAIVMVLASFSFFKNAALFNVMYLVQWFVFCFAAGAILGAANVDRWWERLAQAVLAVLAFCLPWALVVGLCTEVSSSLETDSSAAVCSFSWTLPLTFTAFSIVFGGTALMIFLSANAIPALKRLMKALPETGVFPALRSRLNEFVAFGLFAVTVVYALVTNSISDWFEIVAQATA